MAFLKTATLEPLSVITSEKDFQSRTAERKIVEYDPEFVYVTVRAVTADRPNNNGDAFPHEELIRVDGLLSRPVFESFIGKGVYVNHNHTDDPLHAKGVVLDARYVTANDSDKHIELLLGVDRQKDSLFATSVERGLINKYSMGASVQYTICSICANRARSREEFCEHIAKGKMREFGGKLAYEKCYGVVYNEISAVSDPADETAQLLEKIAKKDENNKAGTVVLTGNQVKTAIQRLETAMKLKKKAQPEMLQEKAPDMSEAPNDMGMMGDEPGMGMEEEGVGENAEVAEVLRVVTDLVEEKMAPEEAVQAIEGIVGNGDELAPPGDELGEPEMETEEFGPAPASRKRRFSHFVKKLAKEHAEGREGMKTKAGESTKVDNQYPYKKRQGDPAQHHTKPQKGRPSGDFDKDQKEYAKLWNISAVFRANEDKSKAAWVVTDNDVPKFVVTGGRAFGDFLDGQFERFASDEYGQQLVEAILEDGLGETMDRVNAEPAEGGKKVEEPVQAQASTKFDEDKLLKAAERKAADLAEEAIDDWKCRFVEGLKVALKAQGKNVVDNPLKAAAFDVLTNHGLDGALAETIIDNEVVALHVDEAIKKAQEYSEMTVEGFEEVKAYVDSLPTVKVAEKAATSEGALQEMEAAARTELRKRASASIPDSPAPGETLNQGTANERIGSVVRANSRIQKAPTSEISYGKPRARA
jgi:hypothetical protein